MSPGQDFFFFFKISCSIIILTSWENLRFWLEQNHMFHQTSCPGGILFTVCLTLKHLQIFNRIEVPALYQNIERK